MSVKNILQTALAPCKVLSDLAVKENNAKPPTHYKTINTLMNSSMPIKKDSDLDSTGALYVAESIYHFFTQDYFKVNAFSHQMSELKITKLELSHEMKHLKVDESAQVKVFETIDRHISVLNNFRDISLETFASKALVATGILTSIVLPIIFNNAPLQKVAPLLIGGMGATFYFDSTSTKHGIDYTPYSAFEEKMPSIRERLLLNHYSLKELNV